MNLVFLGPPGAGKGTMATRLADDLGVPHISTGDIFRAAVANATELGKQVKAIMESGGLVPDELTIALVEERLKESDTAKGYILDGFPRTIPQAEALDGFASIDHAVRFVLEEAELIKRLSGRRVHKPSGRTYHVEFNPPKVAGKDDLTGEPLIQRPDDQEESIRNRLEVYEEQTAPLVSYYADKGTMVTVDAAPKPDDVYASLKTALGL
ncbi:MAG: adenylate kinase [Spirochaetaceae bacterium]|nr:MAG: adenylate kinase [Spirochaetaceae bacterium]